MRLIEKQMLNAVLSGKEFYKDNTIVKKIDDVNMAVYLFGNEIATVNSLTGIISPNLITLARYPSNTTRSRLRALGVNVYQKNKKLYIDDEMIISLD